MVGCNPRDSWPDEGSRTGLRGGRERGSHRPAAAPGAIGFSESASHSAGLTGRHRPHGSSGPRRPGPEEGRLRVTAREEPEVGRGGRGVTAARAAGTRAGLRRPTAPRGAT